MLWIAESLEQLNAQVRHWFTTNRADASPSAMPIQQFERQQEQQQQKVTTTIARVAAATATIADAYQHTATGFAVRYNQENYLIASAHLTNNYAGSLSFTYHRKKYFPVIKNGWLAFAEHIALNPKGSVCNADGTLDLSKPLRDVSILRLVSPETTRSMLYNLSFATDSRKRLKQMIASYPSLGNPLQDDRFTQEELLKLTERFHLDPLSLNDNPPPLSENAQTYSVAHFDDRPHAVGSRINPNPDTPTKLRILFNREQPILPGHSGSPLFDIAPDGTPVIRGAIAASNSCSEAFAIPRHIILEGLQVVHARAVARNTADLSTICAASNTQAWTAADIFTNDMRPAAAPLRSPKQGPASTIPVNCPAR